MKKNTPITADNIRLAAVVVGAICRPNTFRRSREASFVNAIAKTCLVFNVFGDTRKLVRDTIAAMDQETFNAISWDRGNVYALLQEQAAN